MRRIACVAICALCAACSSDLPSIDSFTASATDVTRGAPLTFNWRVSRADKLQLSPRPGTVTGTSVTLSAAVAGTYTLTASNSHGSVSATIPIAVLDIAQFSASPAEAAAGQPVTLSWRISGALSAEIEGAPVDAVQGSIQVNPSQDTAYHLTAHSAGGTTGIATALVRIGAPPAITSFTATPNPVPRGTTTVLSWQAPGAQAFSLAGGDGAGPTGGLHTRRVRPLIDTTYTLTASNAFGSTTQDLAVAVAGSPGTSLVYNPPPAGGGETLRLVEVQDQTSTPTHLVFALEAAQDLALDGLALNLPFDGATPGSRDGIARVALSAPVAFGGLDFTTGSATPAAVSAFPTTGPLAGILTLGMAQKPAVVSGLAGDSPIPAGTALATFALDLLPAGGTGPVFDGTSGDGFRLRLRTRAGDVQGSVAVGRLEVQ